jgi:hypothetical protein
MSNTAANTSSGIFQNNIAGLRMVGELSLNYDAEPAQLKGCVYFRTTVNTRQINGLAQINALWQ